MKIILVLLTFIPFLSFSQITVSNRIDNEKRSFPIVSKTDIAVILYDSLENVLVKKAAAFLAGDIEAVSGKRPAVSNKSILQGSYPIIVATVGNNRLIDRLVT